MPMTASTLADAETLWNYHRLGMEPESADVILGLGSYDLNVAEYSAELYLRGIAPWLMFTGGSVSRDDLLKSPWSTTEAQVFRDVALKRGVPRSAILLEERAANTGENIRFSLDLLKRNRIEAKSLLIVTKPNMERRVRATASANMDDVPRVIVTARPEKFDEYIGRFGTEKLVNLLVGDLQRIEIYPRYGFQKAEMIPNEVRDAYNRLVGAGFTQHLVRE